MLCLTPLPLESFYITGSPLKWLQNFWVTPCTGFDQDGWSTVGGGAFFQEIHGKGASYTLVIFLPKLLWIQYLILVQGQGLFLIHFHFLTVCGRRPEKLGLSQMKTTGRSKLESGSKKGIVRKWIKKAFFKKDSLVLYTFTISEHMVLKLLHFHFLMLIIDFYQLCI